jgi:hypothetical protein
MAPCRTYSNALVPLSALAVMPMCDVVGDVGAGGSLRSRCSSDLLPRRDTQSSTGRRGRIDRATTGSDPPLRKDSQAASPADISKAAFRLLQATRPPFDCASTTVRARRARPIHLDPFEVGIDHNRSSAELMTHGVGQAHPRRLPALGVTTGFGDQGAWPQRAGGPYPRARPERYGAGGCSVSEFGDKPLSMESIPTSATRALGV